VVPRARFEPRTNGDKPDDINVNGKVVIISRDSNSAMKEFLDSFTSPNTKRVYRHGIELFCRWYSKPINVILAERQNDLTPQPNENIIERKQRASRYEKLIEKFHAWMLKNGYKINTAKSNCNGILQLFRYYSMPINLRSGSPVTQTVISTKSFILTPEYVRSMFHSAKDLRSKLLICMGKDLGWRISDVLSIKRSELPNLDSEPPIEWTRITRKEKQISKTCLSAETVTILKEYLFSFPTQNPYLFNNNGNGMIDQDIVNRRLKDLAEDAGIQLGNMSLTWHCFRKMIISQAKNLSIDPDIVKLLVGKSVNKSMLTYMTSVDVKSAFTKLQTALNINLVVSNGKQVIKDQTAQITQLTDAIVEMQKSVNNQQTINRILREKLTEWQLYFEYSIQRFAGENYITFDEYKKLRKQGKISPIKEVKEIPIKEALKHIKDKHK